MNNLMPPTTVKKNLLLTKMSGQQSPVVKCADPAPVAAARTPVAVSAPTPTTTMCTGLMKTQAKPLGVGARVMRALDCLKKKMLQMRSTTVETRYTLYSKWSNRNTPRSNLSSLYSPRRALKSPRWTPMEFAGFTRDASCSSVSKREL